MSTLKIKVVSGCQDWVGKAGILSKRIHLHWEVKRGRRYAWFWRYCFGESAGSPNVQKAAEEFGVSGSGRERSESKTHTWESSGT